MPITLTQLEDKVVAAAEENRPGDTKGIARAVSFVMGTLTQPYMVQRTSQMFFDRNCVMDYIEADDDIDLSTFYNLCYLSRFISVAEREHSSNGMSIVAVEDATRALINGVALKVAMNMVASQTYEYTGSRLAARLEHTWSQQQLEDGAYEPTSSRLPVASYWAPMSTYRFGEAFSVNNATHFEFANEENKQWLTQQPGFNARVLRSLPKGDLVEELQVLGRESLLADMISTDESVLQAQKQLILNTHSSVIIVKIIGNNPAFLHRFLFDDEILDRLKTLSRSRKTALGIYFAIHRAVSNGSFALIKAQRGGGAGMPLYTWLLSSDTADRKEAPNHTFDLIRAVSALYFATALDKPARELFGYLVDMRVMGLNELPGAVSQKAFDEREQIVVSGSLFGDTFELAELINDAECVVQNFSVDRIREEYEGLTKGVVAYSTLAINRNVSKGETIEDKQKKRKKRKKQFALRAGAARQLIERRLQELD